MTVKELNQRMDSRELSEWMAYYRIEPFGEERADLRQAQTSAILANVHRSDGKAFEVKDFMFDSSPEIKRQDPNDMKTKLMLWAKIHNANEAKKRARDG